MTNPARGVLMCNSLAVWPRVPSNERACAECGAGIWVSSTMTPEVDRGELRPLCPPCMALFIEAQDDVEFEVRAKQTDELAEAGVLGQVDQMVTALNAHYRKGPRFHCPRCGRVSSHPKDVEEGYCGHCHDWTGRRDDG